MSEIGDRLRIDPAATADRLTAFIREHVEALGRDGIVMGLSGGIDSSLTATLCVRAVGAEKVLALCMPDHVSDPRETEDARRVAEGLGLDAQYLDITPQLSALGAYRGAPLSALPVGRALLGLLVRWRLWRYRRATGETVFSASVRDTKERPGAQSLRSRTAYARARHRLRLVLLYQRADRENRLLVSAANRSEWLTGFFVKHGCDGAGEAMPILNLFKTQVVALARHLGVPEHVIEKPASPDVGPGITDELAIGMPFAELDPILLGIELGWDDARIAADLDAPLERVYEVRRLHTLSDHTRTVYAPK